MERAKKICKKPFCKNLHNNLNGYCDDHQLKRDYKKEYEIRGSSKFYDWKWRQFSKEFLKENAVCVRCGSKATITDHIIPIQIMEVLFGGNTYRKEHYQPLCNRCNTLKGIREDKPAIETFFRNKRNIEKYINV